MSQALEDAWRAVNPYLSEALSLEPTARAAWLDTLSERDPAVAEQLRACLAELAQLDLQGFLENPPALPQSVALSGQRRGAYTLDHILGHGGMGTVWLAHRDDGRFEGRVAVKLLNAALIGHPAERRFVREGSVLAKLQHPNIARLLDAGVAEQGQPYLVLEWVDGMRIDHYCDAARLSIEQRLTLFAHVLAAVAHAHNHLVIHSDIKPSNILVTADGTVKLLDFGIAKLLREDAEDVTVLGSRALTPEYAAPEQLAGGEISTATDVYSLGVLLYQLLSGRHPTALRGNAPAPAVRATADVEPAPLSQYSSSNEAAQLREIAEQRGTTVPRLQRRLQGDLENIVSQALQKQVARRYPTVAALADDLQRHLTDRPVQARPESWLYRGGKFLRRHRGPLLAALTLLLAITSGIIGTVTQARRAQREAANARHQLAAAESKSELFNFMISEGFGRSTPMARVLDHAETIVQHQFASDPDTLTRLNLQLAEWQSTAGNLTRASALRKQAHTLARALPDQSLRADVDCTLAGEQRQRGSSMQARALYDAAITRLRELRAPEDPTTLPLCLVGRSGLNLGNGDWQAATADAQEALRSLSTPRPDQRMLLVFARATLGSAWQRGGDRVAAAREYRAALTELDRLGRSATRNAPWIQVPLGTVLFEIGDVAAAGELYAKAQRIAAASNDPYLYFYDAYLGRQLQEVGSADRAFELLDHARSGYQAAGDAPTAAIWGLSAAMARCASTPTSCEAGLEQARASMEKSLSPGHSRFAVYDIAHAQQGLADGHPTRARASLEHALATLAAAHEQGQYLIKSLALLARTELQLGESASARTHANEAVAQARRLMGGFEHSAWLGQALLARGLVEQAEGTPAQARASWQAARAELQAALGATAPATREVQGLLDR